MAPAKRPFRPLLAPVLAYVFRPISAVEEQIREADTRLQKAAAVAASPFLFLYHAFYASSNASPHISLWDLPSQTIYETRFVGGRWTTFTRLFDWSDLAGQPVIIINFASHCIDTDANMEDLRLLQAAPEVQDGSVRILMFPCDQFLHQMPESQSETCSFLSGRGCSVLFFDKVKVNGRDASPVYTYLKQASGDQRPIEWNFVKFLVGPDGRTVQRFPPTVLPSEVLDHALTMRMHAELNIDRMPDIPSDLSRREPGSPAGTSGGDNRPSSGGSIGGEPSALPVTRRWRRAVLPVVNTQLAGAVVLASAVLAIFLYPASAAANGPPNNAAIDGVLLAVAVVLLLDSVARFLFMVPKRPPLASAALWLGLFASFSLALDIRVLAGAWAERQWRWRVVTAIRAARIARLLKLVNLVQSWRGLTPWQIMLRYPDVRTLSRVSMEAATLNATMLLVLAMAIAAPFIQGADMAEPIIASMEAVQGYFAHIQVNASSPADWAGTAHAICDFAQTVGSQPVAVWITESKWNTTVQCYDWRTDGGDTVGVERTAGPFSVFFDLRELRRAEAFATIYSVLFVLGAACAFLLFVRDVIEREVVSPLEWVHTMLSTKTAEAYGTLRRAIAFSDRAMERKQRMDPTERMFSQLAKMVLCFRWLAKENGDYYVLGGEEGGIDEATRQWLTGQTGQEAKGAAIERAGLQFVLRPSLETAHSNTTGPAGEAVGAPAYRTQVPRISASAGLRAIRGALGIPQSSQSSGGTTSSAGGGAGMAAAAAAALQQQMLHQQHQKQKLTVAERAERAAADRAGSGRTWGSRDSSPADDTDALMRSAKLTPVPSGQHGVVPTKTLSGIKRGPAENERPSGGASVASLSNIRMATDSSIDGRIRRMSAPLFSHGLGGGAGGASGGGGAGGGAGGSSIGEPGSPLDAQALSAGHVRRRFSLPAPGFMQRYDASGRPVPQAPLLGPPAPQSGSRGAALAATGASTVPGDPVSSSKRSTDREPSMQQAPRGRISSFLKPQRSSSTTNNSAGSNAGLGGFLESLSQAWHTSVSISGGAKGGAAAISGLEGISGLSPVLPPPPGTQAAGGSSGGPATPVKTNPPGRLSSSLGPPVRSSPQLSALNTSAARADDGQGSVMSEHSGDGTQGEPSKRLQGTRSEGHGFVVRSVEPWAGPPLPLKDPDVLAWEVDLFDFSAMDLCRFSFAVFDSIGALSNGYCAPLTLWLFIVEVSNSMHANPYHCFRHAVDVLQTMAHFLRATESGNYVSPLEKYVLCIAALAHDLDHPGVTNAFLVATLDPLAILYNDASVLENHHISSLFRMLIEKPQLNVLALCDKGTLKGVRKIMLEGVLKTDMGVHFKLVGQAERFAELNKKLIEEAVRGDEAAKQKLWDNPEDRLFAMALLLHAADVSNPAKPLYIQEKWAHCVLQEFFAQGDLEAALGLPISPGFDRKVVSISSSQANFAEFVVLPLFTAIIAIFPELAHTVVHMERNYAHYMGMEMEAAAAREAAAKEALATDWAGGVPKPALPDVATLTKRCRAARRKAAQAVNAAYRLLGKPASEHMRESVDDFGDPATLNTGTSGAADGGSTGGPAAAAVRRSSLDRITDLLRVGSKGVRQGSGVAAAAAATVPGAVPEEGVSGAAAQAASQAAVATPSAVPVVIPASPPPPPPTASKGEWVVIAPPEQSPPPSQPASRPAPVWPPESQPAPQTLYETPSKVSPEEAPAEPAASEHAPEQEAGQQAPEQAPETP